MLDLDFVRNNLDLIEEVLDQRGIEAPLDKFTRVDNQRRELIQEVEELKHRRNQASDKIGRLKREGQEAKAEELISEMQSVAEQIKELDQEVKSYEVELEEIMLRLPNIPESDVPIGTEEADNLLVREEGQLPEFDFTPQAHWDLGTELDILDFERGAKVAGARFTFFKQAGARLQHALAQFMLDIHLEEHDYQEVFPPYLVHRDSMLGTGQLPKFEADAFKVEGTEYYLIPTAEVPVTNMYREEILSADELPIHHVAYSGCFRAEAGAHGRDTRGIIRQHQFNKVELVKFVKPENSSAALKTIVENAETILQRLELPYRVMKMCTGDLGFTAAKKYDLEVWMPGYDRYREVSSCSNFKAFQARRAGIRYRPEPGAKARYIHTLNGSGLAVGRTLAAVLENYQQADGTVLIPQALQPYMDGQKRIKG